jgi:hypothetical protein
MSALLNQHYLSACTEMELSFHMSLPYAQYCAKCFYMPLVIKLSQICAAGPIATLEKRKLRHRDGK